MKVNIHFRLGPFVEIIDGEPGEKYTVHFINSSNNTTLFTSVIENNQWCKSNIEYYIPWLIKIFNSNGNLIHEHKMDLNGKSVLIRLNSKSLGDSIAWFPYVEEFRKLHNCNVITSTYMNYYFDKSYPKIKFIIPGQNINDVYAEYKIGFFLDSNKEPILPIMISIQQMATNILGIDYTEIKPIIKYIPKSPPISGKYIAIAPSSTAGLKEWNYENGWEILCEYIRSKGYQILNISPEKNNIKNVNKLKSKKPADILNSIHHSEFFIGLGSGISWLAWALNKHVVMISNFTKEGTEFTSNCTRITNTEVCHGCWNNPNYSFDKQDWFWCPEHKGTDRHFECHKSITPEMVIEKIKHLL